MLVFLGECTHEIKVTFLKGVGYGIRLYTNGILNQECVVNSRILIGPTCRSMLRMEDKCGNISTMANRARHRIGEKEWNRRNGTI